MESRHPESPWACLSCADPIDFDQGAVSLDDSEELHCCRKCWSTLTPAERLEAVRRWRADKKQAAALEAFGSLADAAMKGWHIPPYLGASERN